MNKGDKILYAGKILTYTGVTRVENANWLYEFSGWGDGMFYMSMHDLMVGRIRYLEQVLEKGFWVSASAMGADPSSAYGTPLVSQPDDGPFFDDYQMHYTFKDNEWRAD